MPNATRRVLVATYNVFGFHFGIESAAAAVMGGPTGSPPDVVLVQECGSRAQLGRFASLLGAEAASTHRRFSRVRNAVVYRPPWELAGLSILHDLPSPSWTFPRGMLVVPLQAGAFRWNAVAVHLGLTQAERQAQATEIVTFLAHLDPPVAVGIDLNEEIDGPSARHLMTHLEEAFHASGYASGPTYPADAPLGRIDFLLASGDARFVRAWTGEGMAAARGSDHRPVFAEIEIEAAS